jgi:hypothetical protein
MSFAHADFFPFSIPQTPWLNLANLESSSAEMLAPGTTSKAPRPLDLSIMDSIQVGSPQTLSKCSKTDNFAQNPWPWSYPSSADPRPQDLSFQDFGQEQYAAGRTHGGSGPMPHLQGDMMAPSREFQTQRGMPDRPDDLDEPQNQRRRTSRNSRDDRPQKRKRISAKAPTYDYQGWFTAQAPTRKYRDEAVYDEDCHSDAGSATTCCSSCPDRLPCEDPHCAIPCAESSCEQPICPEDCPLITEDQAQRTQSQQGLTLSSERVSFLRQSNAGPWNSVGSPKSASVKKVLDKYIDPALPKPTLDSQHQRRRPESSSPPTPSIAQNLATPYSPDAELQTPQFVGQPTQASYSTEASTIVGAGGMFPSAMGDWSTEDLANENASWIFNCPWDACKASIPDEQFWMQHLHQAHLDPQYIYGCPLQSNDCPTILSANPLNHLQIQHGFDVNENFSCPAPTCSPAETYNDPSMFHNHFDLAHATPAQGLLHCRLDSCNGSFVDQNQLFSHIHETHQLPIPPPKVALNAISQTEVANYAPDIPDNEVLVAHTCKWKVQGGGICGETCGSEKDLQDHVKIKHLAPLSKSTGYICQWEHCNRPAKMGAKQGFSQRGKLERHMASHTNCQSLSVCP